MYQGRETFSREQQPQIFGQSLCNLKLLGFVTRDNTGYEIVFVA
jgi:hypothetical protein